MQAMRYFGPPKTECSLSLRSGDKTTFRAFGSSPILCSEKAGLHMAETRRRGGVIYIESPRCTTPMETFLIRSRKGLRQAQGKLIRLVVQGAIQIGRSGTSGRQYELSGPASKSWRRYFRTFYFVKWVRKIRAGVNWLSSPTAGRTRRNCQRVCVSHTTGTPSARRSRSPWRIKERVLWHSSRSSTVKH